MRVVEVQKTTCLEYCRFYPHVRSKRGRFTIYEVFPLTVHSIRVRFDELLDHIRIGLNKSSGDTA